VVARRGVRLTVRRWLRPGRVVLGLLLFAWLIGAAWLVMHATNLAQLGRALSCIATGAAAWVVCIFFDRLLGPSVRGMSMALSNHSGAFIDRWAGRWRAAYLSATPVDRSLAERAVVEMYEAGGLIAPRRVWVRSPAEARLVLREHARAGVDPAGAAAAESPGSHGTTLVGQAPAALVSAARSPTGGRSTVAPLSNAVPDHPRPPSDPPTRVDGWPGGAARASTSQTEKVMAIFGEQLIPRIEADARALVAGFSFDEGDHLAAYPASPAEAVRIATAEYLEEQIGTPMSPGDRALIALLGSTGGWWSMPGLVVLCERPTRVVRDHDSRLHNDVGPAVLYPDEWFIAATHGEVVPASVIEGAIEIGPSRIQALEPPHLRDAVMSRFGRQRYIAIVAADAALIAQERDQGIARVTLEMFRPDRFVAETGRVIDSDLDRDGQMRRLWRAERVSDPAVVMVEVVNSTPEPDGTRQHHFLRVPPRTTTCGEAVAWTFGLSADDYAPRFES